MRITQIAISAGFVAGLAALPLSAANAQYYGPPCTPFPLTWPFCIVGAVVGTAATVVSAPFRAAAPYPYGYYQQPYYGAPAASAYPPAYQQPYYPPR
jgi:hypothetical protein